MKSFKVCLIFPKKIFSIRQENSLIKFDLWCWQTLKQFYRYLLYRKNVIRKFHALHRLPRKMALHLLSKFCICESCTNVQPPRRFDLSLWQTTNQVFFSSNSNMNKEFLQSFTVCLIFPQKMICICRQHLAFWSHLIKFNYSGDPV